MPLAGAESQTLILFGNVNGFDLFMIAFTIVIAIGLVRSFVIRPMNKFAAGFTFVCFLAFLVMDVVMVHNWFAA